jgi:hypothetical protein
VLDERHGFLGQLQSRSHVAAIRFKLILIHRILLNLELSISSLQFESTATQALGSKNAQLIDALLHLDELLPILRSVRREDILTSPPVANILVRMMNVHKSGLIL